MPRVAQMKGSGDRRAAVRNLRHCGAGPIVRNHTNGEGRGYPDGLRDGEVKTIHRRGRVEVIRCLDDTEALS